MNLFKCHRCRRNFNGEGDKYFVCPLCKRHSIITTLPQHIFGKTVKEIRESTNQFETMKRHELIEAHKDIHDMHKYQDVSDLHMIILDELEKRHIHHDIIDRLDKEANKLRTKKLEDKHLDELLEDSIKQYDVLYEALGKSKEEEIISDSNLLEDTTKSFLRKRFTLGKFLTSKPSQNVKKEKEVAKYEYHHAPIYSDNTKDTEQFIIEPTPKKAKRILIIKNGDSIKIHSSDKKLLTKKTLIDRIKQVTYPTSFVAEGYLLNNGAIALTDLIEQNEESLVNESTLTRKTKLFRMRINKSANIGVLNFSLTRSKYDIKKSLEKYKSSKTSVIFKPSESKRDTKSGWMKFSFQSGLKAEVTTEKQLQEVLDAEENSYHKITLKNILHTIDNPYEVIEKLYDKLDNERILEIYVPHEDSIQRKDLAKTLWNEQSILFFTNPYLIKKNEAKCLFAFDPIEPFKKTTVRKNGKLFTQLYWKLRAVKKVTK